MTVPHHPSWPYRLAMSIIVAGSMTLGAMMAYVFWPIPMIYVDTPIRVVTKEVRSDQWLELKFHYVKPYSHESMIGFMFASQGHVAFGPAALSALPLGTHTISLYVQVPEALPPGEYVVIVIIERSVRLPMPTLFDRPVTASSEPFMVLP